MKRINCVLLAVLLVAGCGKTGKIFADGEIVRLYEENAPGYGELRVDEVNLGDKVLFNVQNPTLQIFKPENPNGTAVLVVPGGGFCMLSYAGEGVDVAKELNKNGITAFVLKYRLNPMILDDGKPASNLLELMEVYKTTYLKDLHVTDVVPDNSKERLSWNALHTEHSHLAFEDAEAALRYIGEHAGEFGIKRLGMVGFSAGAMITMNQIMNCSEVTRPDFAGIIYGGWYEPIERPVCEIPLFISSPSHDVFSMEESLWIYEAWRKAGIPAELHYYSKAEHGYGADKNGTSKDGWIELFCSFLKDCELL